MTAIPEKNFTICDEFFVFNKPLGFSPLEANEKNIPVIMTQPVPAYKECHKYNVPWGFVKKWQQ